MTRSAMDRLAVAYIVPVVEIVDANNAVQLARTLADAGLPVMEVTLRTPAALDAVRAVRLELPDFLVGAGTLLAGHQVDDAVAAGAHFGVSPGFSADASEAAADAGLPFVPGAVTATEILAAVDHGHTRIKFFPAETSGGAAAIAALSAPFAALGIQFMPTGGIRPATIDPYLALPNVFAVGGTWVASREQIAAGRFDVIYETARHAAAIGSRKHSM